MACGSCGGGGGVVRGDEKFVVEANGTTKEFSSEPEARIYATQNGGKVTVKSK